MGSDPEWPLPSQSHRVRTFLYLSEGVILGAGGLLLALAFAGAYLMDVRTGSFDPGLTAFGAYTLLFVPFLALRGVTIREVSPSSPDKPAPLQDWNETRQWRWVVIVALPVGGVLVAGGVVIWSWWEIVSLRSFDLLLLGTVLAGILVYIYVLHELRDVNHPSIEVARYAGSHSQLFRPV